MDGKGDRGTTMLIYERKGGQRSTSKFRSIIGGFFCLGILLVLAYFQRESLTSWNAKQQPRGEPGTQATPAIATEQISDSVSAISEPDPTPATSKKAPSTTRFTDLVLPRSNDLNAEAIANNQDNTQTLITDSDGTWVVANTQEFTDSDGNTWIPATQEVSSSWTTTTTWSTTVLTNLIIVSWSTKTETTVQDRFSTVTVIGKGSTEDPDTTTIRTTVDGSTIVTTIDNPSAATQATDDSQRPSSERPSTTSPIPNVCPYATCAPTCPWLACSLEPSIMSPELCQMIDPCWNRKEKPPSQGNKCACLCESGYCSKKLKRCAEMNCCHECGCYLDDPMSLQKGVGKC